MIDNLKKYYGIDIDDYKEYEDGITFLVAGINYYFYKTIFDEVYVNEIYNKLKEIDSRKINLHSFVLNKDGKVFSEGYILFKLNVLIDDIDLNDIYLFNSYKNVFVDNKAYLSMSEFWYSKIDYLEYQVGELSGSKLINNSFDYFVGLSEMLLLFYKNNYIEDNNDMCLVHRELNSLSTIEFYNPLNIMRGNKYKDIVSYIRLTSNWDYFENLINRVNANDRIYIFTRMCFPFKYFSAVNKIVLNEEDVNDLIEVLNRIDEYEKYLGTVGDMMNIKLFYWIKKDN